MADVIPIAKPAAASRERIAAYGALDSTLYYASILLPVFLSLLLFLRLLYNPTLASFDTPEDLLYWSKWFWFSGALVVVSNMAGLLYFGSPRARNVETASLYRGWDAQFLLTLSYVSRGDNIEALTRAVRASRKTLQALGVRYRIEIVTDKPVAAQVAPRAGEDIAFFVVPPSFETPHHTKYKARALHYLTLHREPSLGPQWILHLDEESSVTPSAIFGIHRFITDPANENAIGQGEIKYNAYRYGKNIVITALDSLRTGDDLGRFRLQYQLFKAPLFGMHGSYILLPEKLEREIGFDMGRKGSITEDAYFALIAKDRGIPFGWVDGFIREQSPFTIGDILRQRRRWFCGLKYLSFDPVIKLRHRIILMLYTILWSVAWVGPVVTIANIVFGGSYFPLSLTYAAALMQGGYGAIYLTGAYHNLIDADLSLARKCYLYFATLLLLPVSSVLEGLGVLYALLSPVKTFEIVRK